MMCQAASTRFYNRAGAQAFTLCCSSANSAKVGCTMMVKKPTCQRRNGAGPHLCRVVSLNISFLTFALPFG